MTIMYDSVNPYNIPRDATMVAGYCNGKYKWSEQGWLLFPNAIKVAIQVYIPGTAVTPGLGDVLDVEANDAPTKSAHTAAMVWVGSKLDQGRVPCIYTSKSAKHYLLFQSCDYWLADYTNAPHLLADCVATQYRNAGPYDLSVVANEWPRVVTEKPPAPYKGVKYMFTPIRVPDTDGQGNAYWDVPNMDASRVVNVVNNERDPQQNGYKRLPVFTGRLQVDASTRLVFTNGDPHVGAWDATVVTDQ